MTIDDKIRHGKLKYDNKREAAKTSALLSGKISKYEYFTGEELFPPYQSRIIEKAKFTYSPPIEDQGEKQIKAIEEYGKLWLNLKYLLKK